MPVPETMGSQIVLLAQMNKRRHTMARAVKENQLHRALITGCRYDQSAEMIVVRGRTNGVLTRALIDELRKDLGRSLTEVVKAVRERVKRWGYEQVPRLEGEKAIKQIRFLGV